MSRLIEVLSGPVWREILLTLAHSLWQGAAIALVLALVLTRLAGNRPQARYLASLAALVGLVLSCLVTWSILDLPAGERPIAETEPVSMADSSQAIVMAEVQSPKPNAIPLPPHTAEHASIFWQSAAALCSALWIAGTTLMLVRMICLLTGARRLARRPALADPRVLEMVERLRQRLGILRRIVVVEATTFGPAVLGVLRPVLLLPPAISGELSAECLEAILAHELAHIRRHDYLVNLVQMLIEAALFFNPAVWWINRQIRREREACCDALAVRITGQPLTYADALATWIERAEAARTAVPAMAWSRSGGGVLDRIQRLLVAGYRPHLRGSWPALAAGLTVSLAILIALWTGTRAGVALAAEILSPKQRVEQLVKEQGELRPTGDPDATVLVSGTIRTVDGGQLPPRLSVRGFVNRERESFGPGFFVDLSGDAPNFERELPWGKTWLVVTGAPGYAPAIVGPLKTRPGEHLTGLEIVLQRGLTARLRIVDPQAKPIPSAKFDLRLLPEIALGPSYDWQRDQNGLLSAEHVADVAYQLTISAPGFQTVRRDAVRFKPDETLTETLLPAKVTRGVVVTPDGNPVAGATIQSVCRNSGDRMMVGGRSPTLATTDEQGRFMLDSLDDGTLYWMVVESSQGAQIFSEIQAGESDLRWVVGPDWTLTGRVLGNLGKITSADGIPQVKYSLSSTLHQGGRPAAGLTITYATADVQKVGDEHRFEIKNLLPGDLVIMAGDQRLDVVVNKPSTEVTLDLNQPARPVAKRRVVLRLVGTDPGVSASGQIGLGGNVDPFHTTATIKDGRAEFDAVVPGRVGYHMNNVVGYWFEAGSFDVPAGAEPLVHDVPVVAAGAIRGRVLNADGTPVSSDVRVEAQSVSFWSWLVGKSRPEILLQNVPVDERGEFFITPLPLSRKYVVQAWRGFENTYSGSIVLDAANPNPAIDLKFSPARRIQGQVLGPDGQPLAAIPLGIWFTSSYADNHWSPGSFTDLAGRFELNGLSTGSGGYRLTVEPRRDFQPTRLKLALDRPSLDIHLQPGLVLAGRLLNKQTGQPIAGVQVYARRDQDTTWPDLFEPDEPKTDTDGRFRFSTLPEGRFAVQVREDMWPVQYPPPADQVFSAGQTDVQLRLTPPANQQFR